MQYRKFGQLDWEVSALGFGALRLPILEGDYARVAEPEAIRLMRYAIDHGVNYVDTAYPYHEGNSEIVVGKMLQDGYRERVRLATKMPCWKVEGHQDFDRFLNEQLGKLQVDAIDFYLLHALDKDVWRKMSDLGVLDWAEGAIAGGRIGHLGFSFHDDYEAFEQIVDAYDRWTFCQIQYNYMDIENQAGTKGLRYAASKGLAVVIMEPLLGGKLVGPPPTIQALWDAASTRRSPAGWALHWLWNQPEVTTVLSGMSTMEQVRQNVASAAISSVGNLTAPDLAIVEKVRERYNELCPTPCTRCRYCMPCPNGVDIPGNFRLYNKGMMYDAPSAAEEETKAPAVFQVAPEHEANSRELYSRWMEAKQRASACIQCRECEDKCPQRIPISEWMPVVDEVLGQGQPYLCALP